MKANDYTIRLETPADYAETENLVRETFWNVYRPGCLEHYVLHTYRSDPDFVPELDFVMEKDGKLIGQVMYVRASIRSDDGRVIPIMTLGPIGILPEYQRRGYGKKLLDYSMEKAKAIPIFFQRSYNIWKQEYSNGYIGTYSITPLRDPNKRSENTC